MRYPSCAGVRPEDLVRALVRHRPRIKAENSKPEEGEDINPEGRKMAPNSPGKDAEST